MPKSGCMDTGGKAVRGHRTVFPMLDLLRGIAAIAVMLYHKTALPLSPTSAYLAVDLFFLLSGVVVAEAYGERLASGWSLRQFMLVRIVRLWPLYMLGTLVGLAAIALSLATGATPFWHAGILRIALFATVMLPGVGQWEGLLFPLNGAAWSLFAELVVNLVFAGMCRAGLMRWWPLAVLLGTVFLLYEAGHPPPSRHGLDLGAFDLLPGIARAVFSFGVGVAIHRAWRAGRLRLPSVPAAAIVAAFLLMLLFPAYARGATRWALVAIMVGFPVLVAFAINAAPGPLTRRLSALSGRISYPIYTIHLPAFSLLGAACGGPDAPPAIALWVVVLLVVALALPLDRHVDAPVRRWLSHRLGLSERTIAAAKPL